MRHEPQKLTAGPLPRQILRFSIPLILSNMLQVLFNLSDIAVVGRFAGAAALGAVGSTSHLVYLFTSFLLGMGSGVNVLAARYYGAENREALIQTVHTSLMVCAAVGGIILALGQALCVPMLALLGTRPDLAAGAALYMRIYLLGAPALAVYNYGQAVFSAVGDTRRPLLYLTVSGILNVALNLFFVLVCHMDVDGVALASVLSQYLAAVLVLAALFRSREDYGLRRDRMRYHPARASALLALGLPAGAQNAIFAVANLFIQGGVNTFSSTVVEGNAAAANGDLLMFNVMDAFYIACASFVSQNFGAGRRDRVLKSYYLCLAYSFASAVILGGLLIWARYPFLSLFTTSEDVIAAGAQRMIIMCCSYWISSFMDCTSYASRGLGKSLVPVIITIAGSCVFRVIWVYTVFAHYGTFSSLYLVYAFSWTITAAAQLWYFARCYRGQYPAGKS